MHENYMKEVYVFGQGRDQHLTERSRSLCYQGFVEKIILNNHISYNTETDLKCLLRSSSRRNIE